MIIEPRHYPWFLAVDPGDVYTGVAMFQADAEGCWRHVVARTFLTPDLWPVLWTTNTVDMSRLIVERWRLYPHTALAMIGKPLLAAELIGALKVWARGHGLPVIEQPASIIPGTKAALLRQEGASDGTVWENFDDTTGLPLIHAREASYHGWHYLLRNNFPIGRGRRGDKTDEPAIDLRRFDR